MDEPLLKLLKAIRKAHRMPQVQVAACMSIAEDTYRHIEKGRRSLPDIRHGFVAWIHSFLDCVSATPKERETLGVLAARLALQEFSLLLDLWPPDEKDPP